MPFSIFKINPRDGLWDFLRFLREMLSLGQEHENTILGWKDHLEAKMKLLF